MIRCVNCGKFIAYEDIGKAAGFYYEPLNEFGPEVIEHTCPKCEVTR